MNKFKKIIPVIALLLLGFTKAHAMQVIITMDNYVDALDRKWQVNETIHGTMGADGVFYIHSTDVYCTGNGLSRCKSKYQDRAVDVEPNPFTVPETTLMDQLQEYAFGKLVDGITSGNKSETITIQPQGGMAYSKIFTVTWTANPDGSATIIIEDQPYNELPPTEG